MPIAVAISILLYSLAAGGLAVALRPDVNPWHKPIAMLSGSIAIIIHAWLLHVWIDTTTGQNLSVVNLLSLQAWLIALLCFLLALIRPVYYLLLLVFPLAAASLLPALLLPGNYIIQAGLETKQLWHILLSALTVSVLGLAALQALLMSAQEWQLHRQHRLCQLLPSIEVMETIFFQILKAGFVLLTLLLLTSLLTFKAVLWTQLLEKTLLSLLTWLVFALLLSGHSYLGWRGPKAIRWSLSGMGLLLLIYVGAHLLKVL